MPYAGPDDDNLPDYVQDLPAKERRRWVHIFNSAYESCTADGSDAEKCEASAFARANGTVLGEGVKAFLDEVYREFARTVTDDSLADAEKRAALEEAITKAGRRIRRVRVDQLQKLRKELQDAVDELDDLLDFAEYRDLPSLEEQATFLYIPPTKQMAEGGGPAGGFLVPVEQEPEAGGLPSERERCRGRGCDEKPTVELVWGEAKKHTWFCAGHLAEFEGRHGDEIVATKKVQHGIAREKFSDRRSPRVKAAELARVWEWAQARLAGGCELWGRPDVKGVRGVVAWDGEAAEWRQEDGAGAASLPLDIKRGTAPFVAAGTLTDDGHLWLHDLARRGGQEVGNLPPVGRQAALKGLGLPTDRFTVLARRPIRNLKDLKAVGEWAARRPHSKGMVISKTSPQATAEVKHMDTVKGLIQRALDALGRDEPDYGEAKEAVRGIGAVLGYEAKADSDGLKKRLMGAVGELNKEEPDKTKIVRILRAIIGELGGDDDGETKEAGAQAVLDYEAKFIGSPHNPYGTHASKGYPGGREGWRKAWRVYLAQQRDQGPIQGTVRRVSMIAAGMKPVCNLPAMSAEELGPRSGGDKLQGKVYHGPGDYGLTSWKKPSDDDLTREDVQLTCEDLKDIKKICLQEIAYRQKKREQKEEGKAVSLDEQQRRVRDAWHAKHQRSALVPTQEGNCWVKEVFDDNVIVETPDGLYSYPCIAGDDGVEFGEPVKVEVAYQPAKADVAMAVKFLREEDGGAVVGGPLLLWGDAQRKDLVGDYFTPDTQLWLDEYKSVPALFHHGLDEHVGLAVMGHRVKAEVRDEGVWVEHWLDRSSKYWAMVKPLLEAEALYYSPGSAPHLVVREDDGELKSFPVVEDTLTPIPCQHRLLPVEHIKAVYESADIELPDTIIQDDAIRGEIMEQEREMRKLLEEA